MPKLPATISFEKTELKITDRNGQPWLAASELAKALSYSRPDKVTEIYSRNKDEFSCEMTETLKMGVSEENKDLQKTVRIFSPRGCHLIAMFARTEKAKAFRKWVLDVLDGIEDSKPVRKTKPKALPNGLTLDQQDAIKSLVKSRVAELPHEKQGKAAIKLWSSLKAKFGCTYKEIEPENFTEAVSLVSRLPLEGEYIPAAEDKPMSPQQYRELTKEIHQAFLGWCYGGSENQALYNRIRAENNISRFEDLPEDRVEPVKSLIKQVKEMNQEFLNLLIEIKRHYLTEYVGAGAPWTPDLKRKWRKKFDEALPERPNWLEVQKKLTH